MTDRIGMWGLANSGVNDGYGYAGFKIVETFKRKGIECFWKDPEAPVALSFTQPDKYATDNPYRIGYTPWESTLLPEGWQPHMMAQDEIWTTSNFCKEVFLENGVDKDIRVVHHGIDPDEWPLKPRQRGENFFFFNMGEPAVRKNGQMGFDAFLKVFKNTPNVYYVIKYMGYSTVRWKEPGIFLPPDKHERVILYGGALKQQNLLDIFNEMHCLIYPSKGEGFALIPLQAMATGMPSIFPDSTGMKDFAQYGIPMESTRQASNDGWHIGDWWEPSFDDLCDKMKDVYENYERYAREAEENAKLLRREFSWDNVLKPAVEHIKSL